MNSSNYTNKRQTVKTGQWAKFPYVQNQLVYIKSVGTKEIEFYAFFKENQESELKPKKCTISKTQIKEFQTIPATFKPVPELVKMAQTLAN